jgi:hypothetical protein
MCISFFALMSINCIAFAQQPDDHAKGNVSCLEVNIERPVIVDRNIGRFGGNSVASFVLRIRNKCNDAVRVALMRNISLRLDDDASAFNDSRLGARLTGLGDLFNNKDECERRMDDLYIISPGQSALVNMALASVNKHPASKYAVLSGALFLHNQVTKNSWCSNISIENIPIMIK